MDRSRDIEAAAGAVMADVASIDVTELTGGSSAFVARLDLRSMRGESQTVVFRQHVDKVGKGHRVGVAAKEFHLTGGLRACRMTVPAPLALHDGTYTDGPWLVSEFVTGRNAIGMMTDQSLIEQMAGFLGQLHRIEPHRLEAVAIEPIEDPLATLARYLPDDAVGEQARRALDGHVMRRVNEVRLLHGDFWPGNVMIRDRTIESVLDWEDAKLGDPLADVACARVEITCDGGAVAAARFTASYCEGRPDVVLDDLAVWDIYVSATALSGMHRWGLPTQVEAARRGSTAAFLTRAVARLADHA